MVLLYVLTESLSCSLAPPSNDSRLVDGTAGAFSIAFRLCVATKRERLHHAACSHKKSSRATTIGMNQASHASHTSRPKLFV